MQQFLCFHADNDRFVEFCVDQYKLENRCIFLILNKLLCFTAEKDMEAAGSGWRNEMRKYFLSIENLTETVLKRIKWDRIRNNLPFDDSFQKYFLQNTNAR